MTHPCPWASHSNTLSINWQTLFLYGFICSYSFWTIQGGGAYRVSPLIPAMSQLVSLKWICEYDLRSEMMTFSSKLQAPNYIQVLHLSKVGPGPNEKLSEHFLFIVRCICLYIHGLTHNRRLINHDPVYSMTLHTRSLTRQFCLYLQFDPSYHIID